MLKAENIESGYGPMQVLWGPNVEVKAGTITSLLGPNGAGKSTLLWTILGSVKARGGSVYYDGKDVTDLPPHAKVDLGLTMVPEGKHLFKEMTVYDNLIMGAYRKEAQVVKQENLELVYSMFPILEERYAQKAGSLSGGQQQMVTIGRALMTKPKLIMMDEPSQGLAPKLVHEIFETIEKMKEEIGLTILLVEQNAAASLGAADYVYVMHEGSIKAEGTPDVIKGSDEIKEAYLGM
ncbi:MAG: ABC transporter ATP-binding protein [bacterium]|nr:ABC transporter ATP-binding protein [bacterium]MDT8366999.1 ABC transporter ATP-binding protein [bacterium]